MTNREAFEILSVFDFEKISISGKAKDVAEYTEAISIAVDALEKQVPQKPLHRYKRLGFVVEGCCPVCEVSVLPEQVFCAQCGQAIDWSKGVEE